MALAETAVSPRIQDLVRAVALDHDRRPAVTVGGRELSYGDLERRANGLARSLVERGVTPGEAVAIVSRDPAEVVTAMLAVLKAGAVFVPLDPSFPRRRLEVMWGQSEPVGAIAGEDSRELATALAGCDPAEILVVGDAVAAEPPPVSVSPDAPCSIFFTSGSTGRPKAILGRLKGIGHFARWEAEQVAAGPGTRVSQLASPSFDGFLKDVFVPLVVGGTACAPESRDILLDAPRLADWVDIEEIEVLHCVPSVLRALLREPLTGEYFPELRWVVVAGEVLFPADAERFYGLFGDRVRLLNLYGPTETTVTKLFHVVRPADAERATVPIGRPMPGAAALVMGPTGQPCKPGMVGEIHIRTPYRSLGYLGDPEATDSAFIPNPFSDPPDPSDRIYRTGDFGRLLEDGSFEFLGRRDHQVKVRGVRVELGELENHLRRHPAVREAAVVDRVGDDGATVLCAYLVLGETTPVTEFRDFLAERVPDAMVPSAFIELEELPRTLNGKVDRKALPSLEEIRARDADTDESPRSPTEEILTGIWCRVLQLDRVGLRESFFELGGHSLLATQILSRLRAALHVDLPLRTFLESPTVAGLATAVEAAKELPVAPAEPLTTVPRAGDLPLSFAQQRMWFLERLSPGTEAYHIPLAMRVRGDLDLGALEAALGAVVTRHEVLRTSYPAPDGLPVQRVHPDGGFDHVVGDFAHLPAAEREDAALAWIAEDAERPFDLETGPVLRVRVARLDDDDHLVGCTFHHIAADGWSRGVLVDDLSHLYRAYVTNTPPQLPELPVQYADYAAWQRRALRGEHLAEELAFWRERLSGAPPRPTLPLDRPRPAVQTFAGGRVPLRWSPEVATALHRLSRDASVTLFMTLLAAFTALLHRYTGEDDLVVGTSVAGRRRVELEPLIGFFVNMLALRLDLSGAPTFERFLARVRDVALDAFAHQELPFELVVEELEPERDLSYPPLFQVVLSLQNAPVDELELPDLELTFPASSQTSAQYDLLLDTWETDDGIRGTLEYNADLFDGATAERLVRHLTRLVEEVVAHPGARLWELPLLDEAETRRLILEAGDTPRASETRSILDLLRPPPEGPDGVAVRCDGVETSHRELLRQAHRIARRLARAGIGRGDRVGLCGDHSTELVAALLGTLAAGAAYVPLDPAGPPRRWTRLAGDADLGAVLADGERAPELRKAVDNVPVLRFDEEPEDEPDTAVPLPRVGADDPAYVLFTSGSTGHPKGVAVRHGSLVRYVEWAAATYLRGDRMALPFYSPLGFDLTVTTLYLALVTGNPLHVHPARGDEPPLERVLDDRAVGLVKLTPSHLALLRHRDLSGPRPRRLVVGGEALPDALARDVAARWGDGSGTVEIYNEYGPTEATVGCMIHRFDPTAPPRPSVPIGRAAGAARVYLLDRLLRPAPTGVPGEIHVGGAAVALGYHGRPGLTAEHFSPDPHPGADGGRLYRTGDLARRLPDGTLEYLGRRDEQVKLHGHRLEPAEIEAALTAHPDVEDAVVLVAGDGERRRLAAFVAGNPAAEDLRRFAAERLPRAWVPRQVVPVAEIPTTPNGKVDRAALLATAAAASLAESEYVAPETPAEEAVAAIWERVLGVERVGILDDFFSLGGQSILAAQVTHRINQSFDLEIPLRAVFRERTVAGLALLVEQSMIDRLEAEPEA